MQHHLGPDRDQLVELLDLFIDHPHAAVRDALADAAGIRGAVDAQVGVGAVGAIKIERAGAEGVVGAAGHAGGVGAVDLGLAPDHRLGGRPGRPDPLVAHVEGAADIALVPADADGIAPGAAAGQGPVEREFLGVDVDLAGGHAGEIHIDRGRRAGRQRHGSIFLDFTNL